MLQFCTFTFWNCFISDISINHNLFKLFSIVDYNISTGKPPICITIFKKRQICKWRSFKQKIQENKPPLTFKNTKKKICLERKREFFLTLTPTQQCSIMPVQIVSRRFRGVDFVTSCSRNWPILLASFGQIKIACSHSSFNVCKYYTSRMVDFQKSEGARISNMTFSSRWQRQRQRKRQCWMSNIECDRFKPVKPNQYRMYTVHCIGQVYYALDMNNLQSKKREKPSEVEGLVFGWLLL